MAAVESEGDGLGGGGIAVVVVVVVVVILVVVLPSSLVVVVVVVDERGGLSTMSCGTLPSMTKLSGLSLKGPPPSSPSFTHFSG